MGEILTNFAEAAASRRIVRTIQKLGSDEVVHLKRCPFCGGEAEVYRVGDRASTSIVGCSQCGCMVESSETGFGEAWNNRVTDRQ